MSDQWKKIEELGELPPAKALSALACFLVYTNVKLDSLAKELVATGVLKEEAIERITNPYSHRMQVGVRFLLEMAVGAREGSQGEMRPLGKPESVTELAETTAHILREGPPGSIEEPMDRFFSHMRQILEGPPKK